MVERTATEKWLHEVATDASLRASKNASIPNKYVAPELLYAPILWAIRDALPALPKLAPPPASPPEEGKS